MLIPLQNNFNYRPGIALPVKNLSAPNFKGVLYNAVSFQGGEKPDPDSYTPERVDRCATDMYHALKKAEELSSEGNDGDYFDRAVRLMLNDNSSLAEKLIKAITKSKQEINKNRKCETGTDENGKLQIEVTTGSNKTIFKHRTNIFSLDKDNLTFNEFLKHPTVLGNNKKVVVACTGWTKPPAQFLAYSDNPMISCLFDKDKPEQWQKIADSYYVELTKDFLQQVRDELDKQGCNAKDLVFLYGVTPQGVDKAVEEFCKKNNIKCVGVTCYDWVRYLENADESGKPPIYIANNQKEFGKIMGDSSDKIVIVGGRKLASTVTNSAKAIGNGKVIPVNIFKERAGIDIPGVVIDDDDYMTSHVLNAADLLLLNEKTNPAFYPEVRGKMNINNLPSSVFSTVHILKNALENLKITKSAMENI